MSKGPETFLFLSELLGRTVFDKDGSPVGKIVDLAANISDMYPAVTRALVRRKDGRQILFRWHLLADQDGGFVVPASSGEDQAAQELRPSELFLKEALLDRQIVDTDGAKIRRVNDLQFLKTQRALYLVHVDVGFKGLLRRVGLQRVVDFILRSLFDYTLNDQFISWKFVQPVSSPDLLRLTVAQNRLAQLHPADLADIIEELDVYNRRAVFQALDVETAAETLEETDPKIQVKLIEDLDTANASDIIEEMSLSDAADLLADLPKDKAEGILKEMEKEVADDVKELLAHPEEKAGGLMTTSYLSFFAHQTVQEVIESIRKEAGDVDLIYYIYVVDKENHLVGVLSLRDLLVADPSTVLAEIMDKRIIAVHLEEKKNRIAEDFAKYGVMAMPVIDDENRLEGVIPFKNLLEVVAPKLGR